MSFRFNKETFEDNSFNEQIREKLTRALNARTSGSASPQTSSAVGASTSNASESEQESKSSKRLDILRSGITVKKVDFPSIPQLEILDLDVSAQAKSLLKGICKISCKDAMLEITTEIEANLLLLYTNYGPSFTTPRLISNDSFTVPITMTFDHIELEAITNIFVKNTSVGISFNDVNLDFQFDCSIKLLQSSIEKRLKGSMETVFKDVLPSVIFSMSQRWFTHGESTTTTGEDKMVGSEHQPHLPRTILDDSDLADLSPANMLRLSTLVSSRQSLSLNPTAMNTLSTIPGCLERQNLHRFHSRIPSLSTYYPDEFDENRVGDLKMMGRVPSGHVVSTNHYRQQQTNTLPQKVLENQSYDLRTIASIQSRIYERSGGESSGLRRRKIKLGRTSKRSIASTPIPHAKLDNRELDKVCLRPEVTPSPKSTAIHSPQPRSAVASPQIFGLDAISSRTSEAMLSNIPPLQLPPRVHSQAESALPKANLNLLEEAHYLKQGREFQRLRSSLYSPIRSSNFYVIKEKERPLMDNKRLSFVGLAQGYKWGTEDLPPPYVS
ncbi:LAFE_0F16908g1_1 [Lachancea fermentati]|uniref:Mitochondrial distribution and morphology protein 34 n=1 Tax=Lachancea fermentati TaxID=4955 RepID=A0A1G4MGR3_LACFM|nr:LAFE_0F16908g1_1 [Lachancea fermentati]